MLQSPTDIYSPAVPRAADLAETAELRAASYYTEGFHCGEAVLRAVSEVAGQRESDDLTPLASGFCAGLGGSRCICGALAGGTMALGLFSGRKSAADPWEPSYLAAAELRRRWVEDQGAETCGEVVSRIGEMDMPRRWAHCTALVGRTARWVVEIGLPGRAGTV